MMIASFLGGLAEHLPGMVPDAVPAACVPVPVPVGNSGFQVGYCP
jgi:hypothetical protein